MAPPQLQDVDLPLPEPGPRDLRVRLLGWDGAGVVEAVGEAVSFFAPGDRVLFADDITRLGCWR